MNAILILWHRHLMRHVRIRSRIVGSVVQPTLFLVAFGFGLGTMYRASGQGDYLQFLAPAVVVMSVITTAFATGGELVWDKRFGILRALLIAPVHRWQIVCARVLGAATVACFQGAIVFLLSLILGFRPLSTLSTLIAFVLVFILALLWGAAGTLLGAFVRDVGTFQLVMNMTVMPSFLLSGAVFPLRRLPKALELITAINPLTYGIDGFRGLLLNTAHHNLAIDVAIVCACAALTLLALVYGFERLEDD